MNRECLDCKRILVGRIDKKFCNSHCKSNFYNKKNRFKEETLFKKIDKQLKLNRKILRSFNKSGKTTIRKEILIQEGFNPMYFTHYWKTKTGDIYLFVYEYGFFKIKNSNPVKYVLVGQQPYMK